MKKPDIDIDTQTSFSPEQIFPKWLRGMVDNHGKVKPHICGVYPQTIPEHPTVKGIAAIPYEDAEELGFVKLDFLHLSFLDIFSSHEELGVLLEVEPDWTLLQNSSIVEKLFQLSKHADILMQVKPTSVEDLADVLALIRPGKRDLLPFYLKDRATCRRSLFTKVGEEYAFKKSHATGYALVIVLQLHLLGAGVEM